jgi:hypothetical protein
LVVEIQECSPVPIFPGACRVNRFRFLPGADLALVIIICNSHFFVFGSQDRSSLFPHASKSGTGKDDFPCFCMDVCYYHTADRPFGPGMEQCLLVFYP